MSTSICKVRNIFFGKEVRYGVKDVNEVPDHKITYSQVNPDIGVYRGEEIILPNEKLGVGSVICIDEEGHYNVLGRNVPLPPFFCDRCGKRFDDFEECRRHARNCDFKGYIDN